MDATINQVTYKGYTIQVDYPNPYSNTPQYMYYPTDEGEQHDADYEDGSYHYCGNCKWADSIEDAKDAIDDLLFEKKPKHVVIYGDRRVKEFDWLHEAYKFARMFDGDLRPNGQLILNP